MQSNAAAVYRAMESARSDSLFKDPLSARLVGSLGIECPNAIPPWQMITRTRLIDDMVTAALDEGINCVINLGAGLDTRPYRLALPPTLRWIEADTAAVIEAKEQVLAAEQPQCKLMREKVDLADADARAAVLERALYGIEDALVITEDFLLQQDDVSVQQLGQQLWRCAPVCCWITDLVSPSALRRLQKQANSHLESERMKFAPLDGVAFFERMGWLPYEVRSLVKEAAWHNRLPVALKPLAAQTDPNPRKFGRRSWAGVVRFERSAYHPDTTSIDCSQ
jgi:O-methyltransferase involved in polyketide biosynthesis